MSSSLSATKSVPYLTLRCVSLLPYSFIPYTGYDPPVRYGFKVVLGHISYACRPHQTSPMVLQGAVHRPLRGEQAKQIGVRVRFSSKLTCTQKGHLEKITENVNISKYMTGSTYF